MAKLNYVGENGELVSKEFDGLLEAFEYAINNHIRGSKIKTSNGEWDDTDKLASEFKKMLEPINRDSSIQDMWYSLEDVAFDEGSDKELHLREDWKHFKKGASREIIWKWFDQAHSKGVGWLLENSR